MQGHLGYDKLSWVLFPLYGQIGRRHGAITTSHALALYPARDRGARIAASRSGPLFGTGTTAPGFSTGSLPLAADLGQHPPARTGGRAGGHAADTPGGIPPFLHAGAGARPDQRELSLAFLWPYRADLPRPLPRGALPLAIPRAGARATIVTSTAAARSTPIRFTRGVDKTWVLWPLWRRQRWSEDGVDQTKSQFFYFLYWDLAQRRPAAPRPKRSRPPRRPIVWPLFSFWDNGAGRRQLQVLGLLDVFFPDNEEMRESWIPLTALLRCIAKVRTSLRRRALVAALERRDLGERTPSRARSEFHLGSGS